ALERPTAGEIQLAQDRFVAVMPRAGRRLARDAARLSIVRGVEDGADSVRLESHAAPALVAPEHVQRLAERANALSAERVELVERDSERSLVLAPAELRQVLRVTAGEG